jgi:hypothetical protein
MVVHNLRLKILEPLLPQLCRLLLFRPSHEINQCLIMKLVLKTMNLNLLIVIFLFPRQ